MKEIVPAILEKDFSAIREKITRLDLLVNWLQLDVADGVFAPQLTWNAPDDLLPMKSGPSLEVHLMVADPVSEIVRWSPAAERIIVHYEADEFSLGRTLDLIVSANRQAGLALLAQTPLEVADRFLAQVGLIQLMGIGEIGRQGRPPEPSLKTAARIKDLRKRYPDVKISVDGGVSLATAPQFLAAGADQLVVGSAIWRSTDPLQTLQEFKKLASNF